uniref:Thiol methyltransferase 1A n=1 Tax=Canis lupus familiaris TaxID=9615 RepID=A0A8P0PCC5_CANLF
MRRGGAGLRAAAALWLLRGARPVPRPRLPRAPARLGPGAGGQVRAPRRMAVAVVVLRLLVCLLASPLFLLHALGLWSQICKRWWFPHFLARFSVMYNERMAGRKRELFGSLQAFAGPSGRLSLLEVGCGTGANFQFYPPGCRVTCVDPNPNFEKFLIKSIAENRHLQFERFVVAAGEDMPQVADGSVDVVVCTLVLCSVRDQGQILREVCRVLRPGGAFFFLEHVAAESSTWNYFWQQILHPFWHLLFDRCHLTRESWKALERDTLPPHIFGESREVHSQSIGKVIHYWP